MTCALPDDVGELAGMQASELLGALDEMERSPPDVAAELALHRRILAALVVRSRGTYSRVVGRRLGEGPVPARRGDAPFR